MSPSAGVRTVGTASSHVLGRIAAPNEVSATVTDQANAGITEEYVHRFARFERQAPKSGMAETRSQPWMLTWPQVWQDGLKGSRATRGPRGYCG